MNKCLISKDDESWLWNRRPAYIHTDHLNIIKSKDLVSGLTNIKFENNRICYACQKGKHTRSFFNLKDVISSKKVFRCFAYGLIWTI